MKDLSTIALGILIGLAVMYFYSDKIKEMLSLPEHQTTVSSNVLLEKIKNVYKVIVVEGEFADIINYKQNYHGIDFPGFRKKALVKVTAKVSVGYDMDKLKIDINNTGKSINIRNLPEPQILAIDPEISYYDLDEGLFNSFTEEELTKINRIAKDSIYANAKRSTMMESARAQASRMFEVITLMAQESGWTVNYGDTPTPVGATDKPTITTTAGQGGTTDKNRAVSAPKGSDKLPSLGGGTATGGSGNSLTAPSKTKPKNTAASSSTQTKSTRNTSAKSAATTKNKTTSSKTSNKPKSDSQTRQTKGSSKTAKTKPAPRKPRPKNQAKSFQSHNTKKQPPR